MVDTVERSGISMLDSSFEMLGCGVFCVKTRKYCSSSVPNPFGVERLYPVSVRPLSTHRLPELSAIL